MARTGRLARAVGRFGPPLALMALIFALSAQPDLGTGLGTVDLVGRKLVHMTEYGLLWLLWLRALGWRGRAGCAAAALAIAYAITDELHQTGVEGRHGTPVDVAIDATGVALAALIQRSYAVSRADRWACEGRKERGLLRRRATEDARRRSEAPGN
ncbi:MAG: VanZ family protein [Conexibacter sp.]